MRTHNGIVDPEVSTRYKITKSKHNGPIYVNRNKSYYVDFTVTNYTGAPIYVQGFDGKTHVVPTTPPPNAYDLGYNYSANERVSIKLRNIVGAKQIDKTNPRVEYWNGEWYEVEILPSMLEVDVVYCKEANILISYNPISENRHLHTKGDGIIADTPDSLGGLIAADAFADSLFGVIANCYDPEIKYLFASINDKICRVIVTNETSTKEHISVVYTDTDGNREVKKSWDFSELKNHTPLDLNGSDFYIATDPRSLVVMINKYKDSNLNVASISKIKDDACNLIKEELQHIIDKHKIKEQEMTNTINTLRNEAVNAQNIIETLERRLYAEREYNLREKKYDTEDKKYESASTKARADETISKDKVVTEKMSILSTALKTASIVIPIVASFGIWLYTRSSSFSAASGLVTILAISAYSMVVVPVVKLVKNAVTSVVESVYSCCHNVYEYMLS